jgi:hypothetical protein
MEMRHSVTQAPARPLLNQLETAGSVALLGTTSGIEIMLAVIRLSEWWAPPLLLVGLTSLVVCRRFDPRRVGSIRATAACHAVGAIVWLGLGATAFLIGPASPDIAVKSSFFVVMAGALIWFSLFLLEAAGAESPAS